MKVDLIKHILYMFRCYSGVAEYSLTFTEPNKEFQHMFVIKDNYIGYNYMEGQDIYYGVDCTNLDLLELPQSELIPISFRKVLYSFETGKVYSEEQLNIRYEIEVLVALAKECNNSLYFSLSVDESEIEMFYIDKALFWFEETDTSINCYTAGFYDIEKIFGDYNVYWVYGKSPYQSVYKFYSSKETLAKLKGLEFRKIR